MVGFLHFHEIIYMPTRNMYSMKGCQSFVFSAQFALKKSPKAIPLPTRHNSKSKLPFKYLMMCFMAILCGGPTFDMNWLIVLTTNARFGRVPTIAYKCDSTSACMKCLSLPFAHSQIPRPKLSTTWNSHQTWIQPICILSY